MFESIRTRLTATFLIMAIVPVLAVSALLALRGYSTLQGEAITSQEQVAQLAASEIASFIEIRDNQLQFLIETQRIGALTLGQQRALLGDILAYDTTYQELRLLDSDGFELIRESRVQVVMDADLSSRSDETEFLQTVSTGEVYFSEVRIDEATREPLMTIARPIIDLRSGETIFVLAADLRFRPIWDFIASARPSGVGDIIYVTDAATNRLVAHANASIVLTGTEVDLPEGNGRTQGLFGEDVILAQEPLVFGEQRLVVVAERPTSDAFALANDGLRIAVAIIVVTLIIAVIIGIFVVGQIVRPIEDLSATAKSISSNDLSARAKENRKDELGILARSFNEMASRMQGFIRNLEERVAERTRDLKIASDVSREITRVLDPEKLLPNLVNQMHTGFDLYHTQVFIFDSDYDLLRLAAATGEAGSKMIENRKQLRLQDQGLIPLSGRAKEPILANDVLLSTDYLPNTLLPETKSELALPMLIGDILIGVLDLQSDQANRFSEDDIQVLNTLAEQIAIAIRNAELYTDSQLAHQQAEQASQVKSQFLASVSHELRTPLNAILNFTQFVSTGMVGPVNNEQVDVLNKVVDSGKHLLNLINDVLDISKIESGEFNLFVEDDIDLRKEFGVVADTSRALLDGKDVAFEFTIQEDLPTIVADRRRVRQIMLNLVSNACKFTDTGKILVDIQREGEHVAIAVTDSGPGIAAEDFELIFETFRQTQTGLKQGEGTGLGLPISRRLAEAHEGNLWLESVVGKGSTFYVKLPIQSETLRAMVRQKSKVKSHAS